jgi:DNA invertase Pin-like site-specific DNA recombinase
MAQVREHTESTMRQYGLADEAVRLGWPRSDVEVIDTDLGISGRWGVARQGFTELVGRVCSGEVGAIFGIEISRLGRSNADVARLMEFARITGTLLIDADGVYDPGDVNDRMLLGLKGTMGEILCRYRHSISYADPPVMPTRCRGCGLRLEGQRGFIGIIPPESWLALIVLPG